MEKGLMGVLKKVRETSSLSREDIAGISQFIAFQNDRTPESKLHYEARTLLGDLVDNSTGIDDITLGDGWESILAHNANEGHESLQHMGRLLIKNNVRTRDSVIDSLGNNRRASRRSPCQLPIHQREPMTAERVPEEGTRRLPTSSVELYL